jgi:hypothetical protein
MNKSIENWMKEWTDIVNKSTPHEDFWIETPIGNFKNPVFVPTENDLENEITITIKYDNWDEHEI